MTSDKLLSVRHRSVRFSTFGGKGDKRERLPIPGKSLFSSYCYILVQVFFTIHSSFFILHSSLFTNDIG